MSRYVLLIILNAPVLLLGIVGALTNYKTSRISRRRCYWQVIFWVLVGVGLVFVEPAYNILIRHNLTNSTPMSLFDIVLLTGIIFCLLLIKSTNEKLAILTKKFSRMHENLVIAEEQRKWDND